MLPKIFKNMNFLDFSYFRGDVYRAHKRHSGSSAMPLAGVRSHVLQVVFRITCWLHNKQCNSGYQLGVRLTRGTGSTSGYLPLVVAPGPGCTFHLPVALFKLGFSRAKMTMIPLEITRLGRHCIYNDVSCSCTIQSQC